uniref:Uncharacterized protein n=1 Tax=Plectus sambesii TaxID=2011161 RepID=A0A914XPL0_9BILA
MKETTVCVAPAPPLAEQQALDKKDEEIAELAHDVVKEVKESPPPPEPDDNACFKSPAQKQDQLPSRRRNNGEIVKQTNASTTPPPPSTAVRKTSKSTPKKTATDEGDEFIEEEIIDGFAIVSFRNGEDLAMWVKEQDDIRRAKEEAERPPKPGCGRCISLYGRRRR